MRHVSMACIDSHGGSEFVAKIGKCVLHIVHTIYIYIYIYIYTYVKYCTYTNYGISVHYCTDISGS